MPKPLHDNICEESLFSRLYEKHAKNLHDFLYYKFGEQFNPEDKMQEAFVKLWRNCKNVSPDKAKSYLFTVANNMMLNETKHRKVVLSYEKKKQKKADTHSDLQDPQFLMEEDEYLKKYQKALASLTEKQRVVFLMNRVEGKRHKEIAELLDVSRKTVEKRLYSALKKLRKEIKEL